MESAHKRSWSGPCLTGSQDLVDNENSIIEARVVAEAGPGDLSPPPFLLQLFHQLVKPSHVLLAGHQMLHICHVDDVAACTEGVGCIERNNL